MRNRSSALSSVLVLAALGCGGSGDPRDSFVGQYNTTNVVTITGNGVTSSSTATDTMSITTSSTANKIVLPDKGCNLTATVTSDTSFTIDPIRCPPSQNGSCTQVLNVTQGSGSRSGTTLNITASGDAAETCGSQTTTFNFSLVTTATKV